MRKRKRARKIERQIESAEQWQRRQYTDRKVVRMTEIDGEKCIKKDREKGRKT